MEEEYRNATEPVKTNRVGTFYVAPRGTRHDCQSHTSNPHVYVLLPTASNHIAHGAKDLVNRKALNTAILSVLHLWQNPANTPTHPSHSE
jgi:hypothetical protein